MRIHLGLWSNLADESDDDDAEKSYTPARRHQGPRQPEVPTVEPAQRSHRRFQNRF